MAIILEGSWFRTCQECGYNKVDIKPDSTMNDAYANRKCPRCKSIAFDYGACCIKNVEED